MISLDEKVKNLLHDFYDYDSNTFEHSVKVAIYANLTAQVLGITGSDLEELTLAALLHDIGKMAIPYHVLTKPGKLSSIEFSKIKIHTTMSSLILEELGASDAIKLGVLWHHENADGSGYPCGFTNDNINDIARIIHVCDVYDAMLSKRVYKDTMPENEVFDHLINNAGNIFDKKVLTAFIHALCLYETHNLEVKNELLTTFIADFMHHIGYQV